MLQFFVSCPAILIESNPKTASAESRQNSAQSESVAASFRFNPPQNDLE